MLTRFMIPRLTPRTAAGATLARRWLQNCLVTLVGVLVLAHALVAQANANMMTYLVTFTASDFNRSDGYSGSIIDPVSGSFTVTFDKDLTYTDALGVTGFTANITTGPQHTFDYSHPADIFNIGGVVDSNDNNVIGYPSDDYTLVISDFTNGPSFNYFSYTQIAYIDTLCYTYTGSVTVSAVPLPPAWLFFCSGIIPLAWARRRKRGRA
jgi:hypothetical protein